MANKFVADDLSSLLSRNDLPDDVKEKVKSSINELKRPVFYDLFIYRVVVIVLGVIALVTVFGGIAITLLLRDNSITLPDAIVALGSAAVGALAGLLAPTPSQ